MIVSSRLWAAFALALVLVACSAEDQSLVPAELATFESTAKIKSHWQASLDGNVRATGIGPFKTGKVYSRPLFGGGGFQRFYLAESEGVLYAANRKGKVYAVDTKRGRNAWRTDLKLPLSAGVSLHDGKLFVGTLKGDVLALNAENGDIVWHQKVSTELVAPPVSNGSELLVTTIDGRLFALSASDGAQLWSYDHPQPLLTFRTQAAPLIVGSQAFIAFDNGQLLSFGTKEGDLRWSVRVSQPQGVTELERAVDLDATPIAEGPFIISGGANGRIVATSRGTGKISWAEDASVFNELASDGDAVFYVDDKSHVYARSLSSGRELWKSETLHRRGVGSPAVVGDYLVMVDDSNYLHVFERKTGKLAARRSLPGSGYSTPLKVVENTVYAYSDNGALSAYHIEPKPQN